MDPADMVVQLPHRLDVILVEILESLAMSRIGYLVRLHYPHEFHMSTEPFIHPRGRPLRGPPQAVDDHPTQSNGHHHNDDGKIDHRPLLGRTVQNTLRGISSRHG